MTRILITGWPLSGKTTAASTLGAELRVPVRATDETVELGWSEASSEVARWLDTDGDWIIEGVVVARAVRKWLAAHPRTAVPWDRLVYITDQWAPLTPGQASMGAGIDTVLDQLRGGGLRVEYLTADQLFASYRPAPESVTIAATKPAEEPMPWSVQEGNSECADGEFAVVADADGEVVGCHGTRADAEDQVAALYANTDDGGDTTLTAAAIAEMRNTAPFEGVICIAGEPTGDRRVFQEFSWSDLPLALRNNIEESHGGMPQTKAVLVGRIDGLEMRGRELFATGVLDLDSEPGREAHRLMGTRDEPGFLRGVSIDGAERPGIPATVQMVFPAGCADLGVDATDAELMSCMEPQLTIWDHVRVRAATLTPIPAMEGASLYLTDGAPVEPTLPTGTTSFVTASGGTVYTTTNTSSEAKMDFVLADAMESLVAAAHTVTIVDVPPAEWFQEPEMPEFGAITITDDGRIYGYVAPAGQQHRSYVASGKLVTTPMGNVDYGLWATRARVVELADGSTARIATGAITMDCGHAATVGGQARSAMAALEHYDNSCSLFATACIGENKHGVWIAGALLPDVAAPSIARALACQLSGDWRPHSQKRGMREFAGCLLVPVPGLPMASQRRTSVSVLDGALVASATPVVFGGGVECEPCALVASGVALSRANAAKMIAKSVDYDHGVRRAQKARAIYEEVRG